MLRSEENQKLTRVGPGTPGGNFFRQYWQPILLASELEGPDCAPVRVKLLGEKLVAFSSSSSIGSSAWPLPRAQCLTAA